MVKGGGAGGGSSFNDLFSDNNPTHSSLALLSWSANS